MNEEELICRINSEKKKIEVRGNSLFTGVFTFILGGRMSSVKEENDNTSKYTDFCRMAQLFYHFIIWTLTLNTVFKISCPKEMR